MELYIFTNPQQGATYEDIVAVAKAAEDLRYDGFFVSDHYVAVGGLPGPSDAWLTLAALARETRQVRLGTLMTTPEARTSPSELDRGEVLVNDLL